MPDAILSYGIGRASPVTPGTNNPFLTTRSPIPGGTARLARRFQGFKSLQIVWNGSGRPAIFGARRSNTEGAPGSPCLELQYPGAWTFRWAVAPGLRRLTVNVKQPSNLPDYPSLVIKANPGIGLNADVVATSAGGAGWVTIGPASFTSLAAGVVQVELRNNCYDSVTGLDAPRNSCFFDHLVAL